MMLFFQVYLHHTILTAACCVVASTIVLVEGVVVWTNIGSSTLFVWAKSLVDWEEMYMPAMGACKGGVIESTMNTRLS